MGWWNWDGLKRRRKERGKEGSRKELNTSSSLLKRLASQILLTRLTYHVSAISSVKDILPSPALGPWHISALSILMIVIFAGGGPRIFRSSYSILVCYQTPVVRSPSCIYHFPKPNAPSLLN